MVKCFWLSLTPTQSGSTCFLRILLLHYRQCSCYVSYSRDSDSRIRLYRITVPNSQPKNFKNFAGPMEYSISVWPPTIPRQMGWLKELLEYLNKVIKRQLLVQSRIESQDYFSAIVSLLTPPLGCPPWRCCLVENYAHGWTY